MGETIMTFFQDHGAWAVPVAIFCARIVDVSIGTLRIIFVSRGLKYLASVCGFFEVLIWLAAISQIMSNLTSWHNYVAYALGFSAGNFVGVFIEGRLAMGLAWVWIVTDRDAEPLVQSLAEHKYGITRVAARGLQGNAGVLILVARRKNVKRIMEITREYNPEAFVSIGDVRSVKGGFFSVEPEETARRRRWFRYGRKGK